MTKTKISSLVLAKAKIDEWKASQTAPTNTLIYDPAEFDGKDLQLWAFKKNVLVDIQQSIGPFYEVVFVAIV